MIVVCVSPHTVCLRSEAYEQMREIFVPEGSFTGSNVQLAVKGVIRGVLVSCAIRGPFSWRD
jgi:hypothetical protein